MANYKAVITGHGSYVPPNVFTNADLEPMLDTSDEWIRQRTGIEERRWVDPKEEGTAELGYKAALEAIKSSGIDKNEVDCLILGTLSPQVDFPGTAVFVQHLLGLNGCAAYDVRQQCSAFVYSLEMADTFIRAGKYKNVLVIGAEVHSNGLDLTPRGRNVSVLFGDGAGAVLVSRADADSDRGIIDVEVHADGEFASELWMEYPTNAKRESGVRERITIEDIQEGKHYPYMNGKVVFVHAVKRMAETLKTMAIRNKVQLEDIDLFVFHQANLRINQKVAEVMGIPSDKVFNTIEKYANTTAATIPLTLDEAVKAGKLKPGMLVASAVFGSGFTWGGALYRW
ncbi:MAG: 3-oxoacyl-ACP synthase [Bdellovibrionaceae bacterium]|nr:3-oxoacyl-ACP synthase [Pseudobdellovibrionaceae bacterium]|tara:strand:- start:21 stop:1043 length:1023 start_codon:yes stop_codon:yes gene_type:complete